MASQFEKIVSTVLTVAAVIMAISIARREFFPGKQSTRSISSRSTIEFDAGWEEMLRQGILQGDSLAPIKLVEFVDFECPVCRTFHHGALKQAKERYGTQLSMTYVHFPLEMHRFARIAAQAAECAVRENRFGELLDILFDKQDSLGLKSWGSYARESGIRDTSSFVKCTTDPRSIARIDAGSALAEAKSIRGTPTLFVNGWRFSGTPTFAELSRVVDSVLAGRKPSL